MKNGIHFCSFWLLVLIIVSCTTGNLEKIVEQTYQDGSPKIVRYFQKIDGVRTLVKEEGFYDDGVMQFVGEYRNGRRNGTWKTWYDNGRLWSTNTFVDDISDGPTSSYHQNGKMYYEGFYRQGVRAGHWKFWDENGTLVEEIDYKN